MPLVDRRIRVAFVVGEYPPAERKRREDAALAYASPEVEVGIVSVKATAHNRGNAPDLLVNFHRGFRVSWQSAVGSFANALLEDNMRRWSGDHIVDPESVPGILFLNRALRQPDRQGSGGEAHARIIDLAPTILNYLGAPVPASMDGASLL